MRCEIIVGLTVLLAFVGLACSGSTPSPTVTPTPTPTAASEMPTVTPETPTPTCEESALEVSVQGELLQFDTARLEIAAGAQVVLCFNNVSNISQHNWVLVRAGTKDAVASRGTLAGPSEGWVKPDDSDVIAHTKLVDPGGIGEVGFTTPASGTYQFVCTFPGHSTTMFGDLIVTP